MTGVHHSRYGDDRFTPRFIVDKIKQSTEKGITLDPCWHPKCNVWAPITYTIEQNGLLLPWKGNVFVNPPYGRALGKWTNKILCEWSAEHCDNIHVLTASRTDTIWYQKLALSATLILHIKGRLTFDNTPPNPKTGKIDPAPFPSCIFYFGNEEYRFKRSFKGMGLFSNAWGDGLLIDALRSKSANTQEEY